MKKLRPFLKSWDIKHKLYLVGMIFCVWLIVFLTGKVMPKYSSVILLVSFILCYTWLLTLAMVHQKRMELRHPKPVSNYTPSVSVVIAAFNEEVVIEETLRALYKLDYPKLEILVMNDRSTDATAAILESLNLEWNDPRFRYYTRQGDDVPGKAAALNQSMSMTMGEVICVFDADAYVEPDFLTKIVHFLEDENVGAVQARKVMLNWDENVLTRCQEFEYCMDAHFQNGRDSVRGAVELRGNGQLVKREALEELSGWNPHTLTDDLDLSSRLHMEGWDIRFAHKVLVYEEAITKFGDLLKQRRRWAEGSLFRYLEYAGPLIRSRKASLRTTLDMVAYLIEFLFPLWLALDFIQLGWSLLMSDPVPTRIISALVIGPIFSICTSGALVVAIKRFRKLPVSQALLWGLITGLYMSILWFPLVFGIIVKVLFKPKRRTRWDKTNHTGSRKYRQELSV